jgi:uncharacterized protein (TIGR02001 family)
MSKMKWLIAAALLVVGSAAQAGLSSTWTFTTDYDFRGISQTAKYPALQASVDYAWDSGFSVGAWASNLDFGPFNNEKIEIDVYGAFSHSFSNGWNYNVGGVYYTYPGAHYGDGVTFDGPTLSYWEVNAGGGYKNFSVKYWYAGNFGNYKDVLTDAQALLPTLDDSAKAWYFEANYTQPLPKDISMTLHAGFSRGKYWDNVGETSVLAGLDGASTKYEDYSVGFSKTISGYTISAKFIYPNVRREYLVKDGAFANTQRGVLSISTTF